MNDIVLRLRGHKGRDDVCGVVAQVPPVPANADAVARSSNTPAVVKSWSWEQYFIDKEGYLHCTNADTEGIRQVFRM
jgi:hypothetical protein